MYSLFEIEGQCKSFQNYPFILFFVFKNTINEGSSIKSFLTSRFLLFRVTFSSLLIYKNIAYNLFLLSCEFLLSGREHISPIESLILTTSFNLELLSALPGNRYEIMFNVPLVICFSSRQSWLCLLRLYILG